MLAEEIAAHIADPTAGTFQELALRAFALQYEHVAPYRALCDRRGASPQSVRRWQDVPMVPTAAFKTLALAAAPAVEVFRSSGTTRGEGQRSVHHHSFPDLYRRTIEASFPRFCLPGGKRRATLSLVPSRQQAPDSSLAFMIDHVVARFGAPESLVAFSPRGVEVAKARSWLAARQREHQPALIMTTALALMELLESLARIDLRFRLPAGSVLFETGGFKGRTREIERCDLVGMTGERLGLPPEAIVREYGMTELTSQFYTEVLAGGDPDRFVGPRWARARVLDPLTLVEAPAGAVGLLAIFDLANLGSAIHLLTEDLAAADGEGFRLVGRAAGAELRGCSLMAEELVPESRKGSR